MIERGMTPPPPRQQPGRYYGLLIAGAILFAFGLAMLACLAIIRVACKSEPADKTDFGKPPLPPRLLCQPDRHHPSPIDTIRVKK